MSTVGDLKQEGLALEVGCMNCQQHGFYDPASLSYPDDMPVEVIVADITCKQCGFANKLDSVMVWARASKHRVTEFPLVLVAKAPAIENVPLGSLVNSDRELEAECVHCGARQPVDIEMLIEQHGRTATLEAIASEVACLFSRQQGMKVFEIGE